jgi:hypothetical protein
MKLKALLTGPIIVFFVLMVATSMLFGAFSIDYGTTDFWQKHGWGFLIAITFFPRLTLLFSSVASGGLFWWIGFIFTPRLLVAILATIAYLHTNPLLVFAAWVVAISGEVVEKKGITHRHVMVRTYAPGGFARGPREFYQPPVEQGHGDVIEAEFKKSPEP